MDSSVWRIERAGQVEQSPTTLLSLASAALRGDGELALVAHKSERALGGYVVGSQTAAGLVAQAVGGRAVADTLPDLAQARARVLAVDLKRGAGTSSQIGADPAATSHILAQTMAPGMWVAATLRTCTPREEKRWRPWLLAWQGAASSSHDSLKNEAAIVRLMAGGAGRQETDGLLDQLASGLPGYDMPVKARSARPRPVAAIVLALASFAVAAASLLAPFDPLAWPDRRGWLLAGLAAGLAGLAAVGFGRAKPTRFDDPIPKGPPLVARPRRGTDTTPARTGTYPLHPTSIKATPAVVIGLVAPQAGAESGSTATADRPVPGALRGPVGPMIGDGAGGTAAHLDASQLWGGVAILGEPGSGKSILAQHLWAYLTSDRVRPTGLPGLTGADTCLIAFENKGDGADQYAAWSAAFGDRVGLVDLADEASPAIDMFGDPAWPPARRASLMVDAIACAFADTRALVYHQNQDADTLRRVLAAALLVDDRVAADADLPTGKSPVFYANTLLGEHGGDDAGCALHSALVAKAGRAQARGHDKAPWYEAAVEALQALYGPEATPARRRDLQASPRAKLAILERVESFFAPARPKVTFQQILAAGGAVVVNTGSSRAGTKVDEQTTAAMSAMLMSNLKAAIENTCARWDAQGRSVAVFADELSLLAGHDPEIIAWLREQGRGYGIRPVFATQYVDQLHPVAAKSFLGYTTLISFSQQNPDVARQVADDFALDGSPWTPADIAALPRYTAAVRTKDGDGARLPVFTVATRLMDKNPAAFDRANRGAGPPPKPGGPLPW